MTSAVLATAMACTSADQQPLEQVVRDWCRAHSTSAVFEAGLTLGHSAQEMTVLLDDITVRGWPATEQDARYVRACRLAYGQR
jgi:hypothetical protein